MGRTVRLPASVTAWRDAGRHLDVDGHRIFVVESGTRDAGPPVVFLHGFPGSSHDFARVVPLVAEHRPAIAFDYLGYGLSDKPRLALYSPFELADLTEAVLTRLDVERCVLVGHDLGDTVISELLFEQNAGNLRFGIDQVFLTNGAIFIELAHLTGGQRLALALPTWPLRFPVPTWLLRRSLSDSFAHDAPPPPGVLDAMVALIQRDDGDRLLTRQIAYISERRINQDRWTAGLVDFDAPLTALWGERDPVAGVEMTERLAALRPDTEVVTWPDVGHWPSVEAPERLAAAIVERLP